MGLAFAVFYPFTFIGIDPHHDGIMLKTALDVAAGQQLFRDTFNQYGALTSYLQACFLSLTSRTLWNLRLLTLLTYAAIAALQYFSAALYLPRALALAVTLFWMATAPFFAAEWTFLPWASAFAIFFQLVGIIFFQFGTRDKTRQNWLFFWSGLCLGLTFLCRQPVGFLSLLGVMGAVFAVSINPSRDVGSRIQGLKRLLPLLGGFAAVMAGFLLQNHQANSEWWYQTFTWPHAWTKIHGTGATRISSSLFSSWNANTLPLVKLFFGEVAFLIVIYLLGRKFPKIKWPAAALFAAVTIYWAQKTTLWAMVRWGGLATGMPLILIGAFFVLWVTRRADRRLELMALAAIGVASWHQFYPVACNRHLFWSSSLSIGPAVYLLYRAFDRQLILSLLAFAALTHPLFLEKYKAGRAKLAPSYVTLREPPMLAGMKVLPAEVPGLVPHMTELHKLAERNPATPFLLEGGAALELTLAKNLRNPSPIYVSWGFEPHAAERRIEFLKRYQPIVIIPPDGSAYVKPRLHEFHYNLLYKDPGTGILVYGPPTVSTDQVEP